MSPPEPFAGPDPDRLWRRLETPESVARLGGEIARLLILGDAVCLSGPLGAGKSTLARGLIQSLAGAHEEVPSPTFTLVQTYEGPAFPLAHFDLYRLRRAEEAAELGLDEALEMGVAVIEWPERLAGRLPWDRLDVDLGFIGQEALGRRVRACGRGTWAERARRLPGLSSAAAFQGIDDDGPI